MAKAFLTDCDRNGRSRMIDSDLDLVKKAGGVQMGKHSGYNVELRPDGVIAFLPLPTLDSGPAPRTLVASFPGSGFTAEREGDSLNIYLISNDPVATGSLGDRRRRPLQSGMSATQLQAINKASRGAGAK